MSDINKEHVDWEALALDNPDFVHGILNNKYIPHKPFKNQLKFLVYPAEEILYGGGAGGGKALDVDTLIPTIDGFKRMGDIKVGDIVFTENGEPTPVLAVSPIFYNHRCYQVDFKTVSIICDENHIWTVRNSKKKTNPFKNYTAKELANLKSRMKVPVSGIAEYDKKTNLPAYTIGAWLGDGHSYGCGFTTVDLEILDYIEEEGFSVKKWSNKYEYGIYGLHKILRENNVLKNKHIPHEFYTAPYDERLALVQGLMDTDGNINKNGSCEFTQKDFNIINGLRILLASLGIKCNINETFKKAQTMDEPKKYYRLKFYTTLPVFKLKRKRERLRDNITQSYTETILNIKEVESRPTKCITVANPTGLYLATEQFIPTHNSDALLMSALQYVGTEYAVEQDDGSFFNNYNALILRRSYQDLAKPNAIMDRCRQWLSQFVETGEVHWDRTTRTYTFPSVATLTFGYLSHDNDLDQYQGSELQFVGFDELTQFTKRQYTYLHSRLRRLKGSRVPIRMRGASNPGNRGHDWVKEMFVAPDSPCAFIPSLFQDNIYLDAEEYSQQLDLLDEIDKQQLKLGDWDAELSEGLLINREQLNERIISPDEYKDWVPVFNAIGVDKAATGDDEFALASLTRFSNGKTILTGLAGTTSSYPEEIVLEFIEGEYKKYKTDIINFEREPGSDFHYSFKYWINILKPLIDKFGITVIQTPDNNNKYNRAKPHARAVRKGDLLFSSNLDLNKLFTQYIYVHPDKSVMKEYPSPDRLDAVSFAYMQLEKLFGGG